MAKHRGVRAAHWWVPAVALLAIVAVVIGMFLRQDDGGGGSADAAPPPPTTPTSTTSTPAAACGTLKVVAARSFVPMLDAVAPQLQEGPDCVRLAVTPADGRAAAAVVSKTKADVWIPDDSSWASSAGDLKLANGAGAVLATSPIYMVSDAATGRQLRSAGGSWAALAKLVDTNKVRLVIRDPAGSGEGLIGTGAAAEAVWMNQDMDASALWLARAQSRTRTVAGPADALRTKAGEVGLVPEYAVAKAAATGLSVVPGGDFAAMLRYTWLPTATGVAGTANVAGLKRLHAALSGPEAATARAAAGLRAPDAAAPPATGDGASSLPASLAKPLRVLPDHHIDHVFATWYPRDRRTDALIVVDISGSMAKPAPGSTTPLIGLVREGVRSLGGVLPDDARLGLWEFGSRLDGTKDHRELLREAPLNAGQRKALTAAVTSLDAERTGTGLHDTILAAYTSARDRYRPGVPNQVMVFTDGENEDDPGGLSASALAAKLKAAQNPARPVQLSVVTFGDPAAAKVMEQAVQPVDGYVDVLTTPGEVSAVFIHVAAGGLHH